RRSTQELGTRTWTLQRQPGVAKSQRTHHALGWQLALAFSPRAGIPSWPRSFRKSLNERTATRRTRGVLGGRSERVVQQVLVATVAELAESGYRAFRMDAVSAAARVNKTTIYR